MLSKYLAAALIGSALLAAPALAQNTTKSDKSATAQTASATGLWQGSKLIGLNVYNNNNEKIGDIKELMVDKSGKIDSVAIAVGGFLGMGEHDVAVKFSELKWVDEPVSTSTSSSSNARPGGSTATTGTNTTSSKRNYPDHAMLIATKD